MSDPTCPYEPLTSENTALVLIDHQVGLMAGVRDYLGFPRRGPRLVIMSRR